MTEPKPVLLMTRPVEVAIEFIETLPQEHLTQVKVIFSPLMEIKFRTVSVNRHNLQGVIFTSRNGVKAIGASSNLSKVPAYCVGKKTTELAQKNGWKSTFLGLNAEEFIPNLIKKKPSTPLIHFRGQFTRGKIAEHLTNQGLATTEQIIYDQIVCSLTTDAQDALISGTPIITPLFSPRTAMQFAKECTASSTLTIAALSIAVADALGQKTNYNVHIAPTPNAKSMGLLVQSLITSTLS
ncbi:MAG: uroporphyrinogen-III synthase [Aestuariivita sp.]|nr:uroporphyrinogen-III synthase [Aestuariivita sp.]